MRNLALQGEIRHILPGVAPTHVVVDYRDDAHPHSTATIVAVISNSNADLHHNLGGGTDLENPNYHDDDNDNNINDNEEEEDYHESRNDDDATDTIIHSGGGGGSSSSSRKQPSKQPPVSFVVTSDGWLYALDGNDELAWRVDLEKVVEISNQEDDADNDDNDEDAEEEGEEGGTTPDSNAEPIPRSKWFYASSILQESSPDDETDNNNGNEGIMGMDLTNEGGLHLTCLSHAGHVVSVSIDATNAIALKLDGEGGIILEEGSECIGSFENGLECGGWSPDGEVLALVTFANGNEDDDEEEDDCEDGNENENGNNTESNTKIPILMTMNTQYEILSELRLDPCLFPLHSSNNRTTDLATDEAAIHPNAISFCWRPDSSSLALSTMDANIISNTATNTNTSSSNTTNTNSSNKPSKPLRRIRTYHRTTLQLISLSKEEDGSGRDVPNLLPIAPTWAPAGCSHYVGVIQSSRPLVASSSNSSSSSAKPSGARARQVRQASMQVAFMEPNGLRHRECKIHNTMGGGANTATKSTRQTVGGKEEVTGVAFNLEGDLLAVTLMVTPPSSSSPSNEENSASSYGKVQLYHRNNYHWYLKYELRYDTTTTTTTDHAVGSAIVSGMKFSEEDPYRIMIALHRQGGATGSSSSTTDTLEWREYTFRWESSTVYYSHSNPTTKKGQSSKTSSVLAMAVDGKTVNFTPLDKAIVPPPMYASSLELPAPVVGITTRPCFHHEIISDENDLLGEKGRVEFVVTMSDGRFALLQSGGGGGDGRPNGMSLTPGFHPPMLFAIVDPSGSLNALKETNDENEANFTSALQGMTLRDVTIIDADKDSFTVIAVSSPKGTSGKHHFFDNLVEMKISWNEADQTGIEISSCIPLEGRVLRIVNWSDTAHIAGARGSALVELTDGTLLEYSQGGAVEHCEAGPLLEPCPWIAGLHDSNVDATSHGPRADVSSILGHDEPSKRLVIGLSSRYRLYCGERLLSSASSSFVLSLEHRFLAHITLGSRSQLRFLPIASLRDFDPLMGSDENEALDGYEPRSVERGARLVAIFPIVPTVVIQMPRGNLESISPRALVLPYTMMKIDAGDYYTALDIMRRQRVDMNLIVDFNPSHFLEMGGAEQFVGQIEKIDNINLFLSSLIDVDTTLWKYPIPSWIKTEKSTKTNPEVAIEDVSKVNQVCTKVREVMLNAENEGVTSSGKIVKNGHFLLPILSSYAKQNPPMLEEALSLIKSNAPQNNYNIQARKKSVLLSDSVQSSIQYLAFLADYELIFNTAIGMYDFDLAKAVARHSQMDPKVYLPMLKRWRELPESAARYEVDVKLKRYESALRHLVAAGRAEDQTPNVAHLDECLKFIEEHALHKLALELFENDQEFRRSIMVSLGEHLLSDWKADEALTVFLTANPKHLDGAKRAARTCGDWKAYFACCAENNDTMCYDEMSSIAAKIAEDVSSRGGNMQEQRECYSSAARILLDYGQDVAYATDMFISAHMWSEGRRVAYLHNRPDLVKKCIDASVSYANTCIEDFAERASTFEETNKRYGEVIAIRRQAIKDAEEAGENDPHLDDSASVFSMQSTASNTSLRSTASGSSVGSVRSVASVSTVISVGAVSSFSFSGELDQMKHKSKFNKIGRDKSKKKKKRKQGPASRRMKPGSEEELKSLVDSLTFSIPNEHHVAAISETITFLMQSGKQALARLLFEAYQELESTVTKVQTSRLENDKKEHEEREKKARKEGHMDEFVMHSCEKNVNALNCKPLPDSVHTVFSFLT